MIDRVIRRELPQGPCWRRYNHDAYGQKDDGSAFDGTGVGRSWPILTGERGHYELAAGHDPLPYHRALERMANAGGMLAEQLWDDDELARGQFQVREAHRLGDAALLVACRVYQPGPQPAGWRGL